MDPKQISNLAKLFRDSGDQILNSDSKLTLSGPLLRALNDSFSLIADKHENYGPKTFQVVKPYNSKSDVFRDLQLIHDFVQKTHILSLIRFHDETINGIDHTDTADLIVDIGKFHNLKTLEIHRIPIGQIRGIQQLRSQLQELIGIRCIDQLKTIMTACGNDQTSGFIWTELKSIDFSFNGLRTIDNSLEFAPWLQCLNLSHNQINHIGLALKFLPHLTVVNLSFNQLRVIPKFHSDAAVKHLRILQLANNFIEDITGISRLDALVELDLSNNCLLDHSHLLPVITLISLQYLNLMGNPLFYHPRHREATARYLHKSTATVKFQLDQSQLTKSEKLLTGQYSSYQAILITSDHSSSIDNNSIYDGHQTPNRTSSFGSVNTLKDDLDLLRGQQQQQQPVQQQRKSKPRRAIILEKSNSDMDTKTNTVTNEIIINSMDDKNQQKIDLIDKKPPLDDHLDTKRKIEDLRKHYGDEWLHSQGSAEMVKSVIGIMSDDKKRIPLNINSDNLFESNEVINADLNTTIKILSSTPIDNFNNKSLSNVNLSQLTNYQSIDDLQEESETSAYKSIIDQDNGDEYEHLNESTITTTVYPTTIAENIDMDIDSNLQQISDTEDNEYKYIVYRVLNKSSSSSSAAAAAAPDTAIDTSATVEIELFLIVSDLSIKEKDCLNGKTITKWQLKSILSCERRRSNILHIQFDTIRKDKKERLYRMETATGCFKLEQYLRDLLARRPLSEMNQTTYRCANCTTHFSRENIYKKQNMDVRCPQCKSSYVIEIKESTINYSRSIEKSLGIFPSEMINNDDDDDEAIDAASATEIVDESVKLSSKEMEQSTISHNSIAPNMENSNNINIIELNSVSSLIDEKSSSCSKLSNGIDDSLNSNQSVAGSSTNCEDRDADFPIEMSAGEQLQNYDSDVDILSNPSQSSIEILLLMDGSSSINSSRKHSEERRLVQSSGIETTATTTTLLLDGINTNNDNDNNSTTNNSGKNKTNTNTELRNLTESSSSGSITDSICTSYEKQSTVITTTMATTTPSTLSTSTNLNLSLNSNVTKSSASSSTSDAAAAAVKSSSSSSMLGGLFQSTNLLMSRTPKKMTTETVTTSNNNNNNHKNNSMISMDEQFKFNYTKFDVIDHRLKLYFYQHLFKDNNEHFKCLVKCVFISEQLQQQQQQIDQKSSIINGLLVISSTKLYLLQCNDNCFTDDIGKWLKKQLIISIDRIKSIKILPWKIGITLQIESIGNYHIILYDIIRTENFFLCLRSIFGDNIDVYSTLDFSIDDIDERILLDVNDKILYKLIILNSCKIEKNMAPPPPPIIDSQTTTGKPLNDDQEEEEDDNKEKQKCIETLQYPILIVTDANLYLTLDYKWILTRTRNEKNINESSSNISSNNNNNIIVKPILKYVQSMSNLFEIDRMDQNNQQSETKTNNNNNNNSDQSFTINFMDEGTDQMECWHCHFETDFCKITTYHAISQSWEVVFGIPFGNN